MQFAIATILAYTAFAVAMPAYGTAESTDKTDKAPTNNVAVANGSGNDNDSSKVCDAANNGKVSCCEGDNSSDGGILGLNGLLGGNCEVAIDVLNCQNTQTQACCPTSNQTGLIPVGSICVPISL